MAANCRPVGVGVVFFVGECQRRSEFRLGGGDGGAHVARRCVDEHANGVFAVGGVWDWFAIERAAGIISCQVWMMSRNLSDLLVFNSVYVPAMALRIWRSLGRLSAVAGVYGTAATEDARSANEI